MTRRNVLMLDAFQLMQVFKKELPYAVQWIEKSESPAHFNEQLQAYAVGLRDGNGAEMQKSAGVRILNMLETEGKEICDFSTGRTLTCDTFSVLWKLFRGQLPVADVSADYLLDIYYLFLQAAGRLVPVMPDAEEQRRWRRRWPSGTDRSVVELRRTNKRRIIRLLIEKIERRTSAHTRYNFEPGLPYAEKELMVNQWWGDYRFHLAMAIRSPRELNYFLGHSLSPETMEMLTTARKKKMPFFITPYYLSLLNPGEEGYDDRAIRSYVLYSPELVETYGNIMAWEKEDRVVPGEPNAAGWLLPEGHNIHRRYPDVAILIPDSMGRACGGLCAPCQRMYDFQRANLNFEFDQLKPKESWDKKLRELMRYFEEDSQLRDILITGGDALMSQNRTLKKILDAVYKMALRKRQANAMRKEGEKYAEIQRIRLGSRLPAYLPMRINDELIGILREFREKAAGAGIRQFIIQTHFETPLEVTPAAVKAIQALLSAGWLVTNQLVFTVAASRRGHTAKLRRVLNKAGVICYYTFSVKGFRENYAMFAPNSRSLQEKQEEKQAGLLPTDREDELMELLKNPRELKKNLSDFLEQNDLPFAATDRNVLNLPGIGKSMTFSTIGVTSTGERILCFKHDTGRMHSPAVEQMENIYIIENKPIGAYLRQLEDAGETVKEYQSVWSYHQGATEPRFRVFEYPETDYRITDRYTHLGVSGKNSDFQIFLNQSSSDSLC